MGDLLETATEKTIRLLSIGLCAVDGHDPFGPTMDIYVPGDPHAGIPWAGYRAEARAIAAAREAELRAEVERLTEENARLAMFQCHAGYGDEYGNPRCAEQDRLRALLDEARKTIEEVHADMIVRRAVYGDVPMGWTAWEMVCATLAKIGGQHD